MIGPHPSKLLNLVDAYGVDLPDTQTHPNKDKRPSGSKADRVVEGTDATFVEDVISASAQQPVLVDFWANWCQPCKQLSPILIDAVEQSPSPVRLVTIDVDQNPLVAGQLQVRSLPTVFAFLAGKPVDGFAGSRSADDLHRFIEELCRKAEAMGLVMPEENPPQNLDQVNALLDAGNTSSARALIDSIPQRDLDTIDARLTLARCATLEGSEDESILASLVHSELTRDQQDTYDTIQARLDVNREASAVTQLGQTGQSTMDRFIEALTAWRKGEIEQTINTLLGLVETDPKWDDGRAQRTLVKVFRAIGEHHPATRHGRRQLSSLLFR